jgi:RHS repeat-associated protein
LTDRLGSVRDIVNSSGSAIDHIDYTGFGGVKTESNPTNGDRFKYTGRELDSETGFQRNGWRMYDSNTGRWMQQDPIGFAGGDANLYRYVRNSPTNYVDPNGLYSPVGHHPVPVSVLNKYFEYLSWDAYFFGLGSYSGPLKGGHRYSKAHGDYIVAVEKEFEKFLKEEGVIGKKGEVKKCLTSESMKKFASQIENGLDYKGNKLPDEHIIATFNQEVRGKILKVQKVMTDEEIILLGKKYAKNSGRGIIAGSLMVGALSSYLLPGVGNVAQAVTNQQNINKLVLAMEAYYNSQFGLAETILAGSGGFDAPNGGLYHDIVIDLGGGLFAVATADQFIAIIKKQHVKAKEQAKLIGEQIKEKCKK